MNRHPAEANKLIEELYTTIPYEWEMYFRLECEIMPKVSKALDDYDRYTKPALDRIEEYKEMVREQ